MKKNIFGRQFKRDANERKALFKNLLTSLVIHERIQTSVAKAKAIKAAADKLVTKAKKGGDHSYRLLHADLRQDAVVKMINDIAPRFADRQGGYTRIVKVGRRIADNSPEAIIEWTEKPKNVGAQNDHDKNVEKQDLVSLSKKEKKEGKAKATKKTEKKETKKTKSKNVETQNDHDKNVEKQDLVSLPKKETKTKKK